MEIEKVEDQHQQTGISIYITNICLEDLNKQSKISSVYLAEIIYSRIM